MKNKLMLLLSLVLIIGIISGCGSSSKSGPDKKSNGSSSSKTIDDLKVSFVPSKDPDQIITATDPLKKLLKDQLKKEGYTVNKVDIDVGTTYEAVGEALDAGTTDIGFIPGGTYVLYDKGADVILTATRAGLNNDSDNPKDWNDNKPTTGTDKQASYYRALFIAGPSKKGQELAKKVNSGQQLTWNDLNSANWAVMSSSSSAGYIYPTLWLQDKYKKGITDLAHVTQSDSYGSSFARLASGQADVIVVYADARRDFEKSWTTDYKRSKSIWDETNVIGVTQPIYNDTISVSKNDPKMTPAFKKALQDAFISIAKTDAGKKVIAVYSHEGYKVAKSSDYDGERKAQELLQSLNK
ncbi:PhnD/SsuA/transferrin family substrate-binding protein [Pullulanibacillus sp. KACC 23026]|uniref:phosphate/phosphite/phosphonate ABC transporter substrate-binding protein n=1 Tax=Pullulanibacillus sp. KACC 23026 TaxID=3028315 RepID=UPI0023B13CBF|nr:PhnD/SsuA/transferrin family substrate-binding protein [Pullulanibacillus sp. KACC 23026]WEG12897.1 PhnD/SsuA/transferrin family substrate-binding protein [Pullulanibacillus sp. KACC 23026]